MNCSIEEKNIRKILINIYNYLPSRFLIIFSAAFIIPLLSNSLSFVEMSVYLIAIQILNLVCTTSSDGIGKIVLRFYDKYKIQNKLEDFFSSVFWLSVVIYIFTWLIYFISHNYITEKFSIDNTTLVIILLLVIPCGIRQFLYQILRVYQEAYLYTFSIVLYQVLFIIFILTFVKHMPSANVVLLSMSLAIVFVDLYVLRKISLPRDIKPYIDKNIISEILKYSIPLFLTNACYWAMLNISKFIFQYSKEFSNTAISGATSTFSNLVMQPLVTVFIFASFPILVKKYEMHKKLKTYFTNLIQLFCVIFIPLISTICFYSKEITNLIFPSTYDKVYMLLPFYIVAICLHELTKLVNVKYHLKNVMHVELVIALITVVLATIFNYTLIIKYGLIGAAIAMFLCESCLLILNLLIRSKRLNYINYAKILKSSVLSLIISILFYEICTYLFTGQSSITQTLEIVLCLGATYYACFIFRKKILY